MKISPNFSRSEFACKCGCGQDTVDVELIVLLEKIRAHFNAPITIHSGNRCTKYNKSVGGKPKSQHLLSRAADFTVKGVTPEEVYNYCDGWHTSGGLGKYKTFTHIDTRGDPVRWHG